jgi:flagellar biosynthetic protein FliP
MNSSPDMVTGAFQMLTALGIVLGGLLLVFYFIKRYVKREVGGRSRQLIKVIANQYIGVKKNIALVEVPGSILVVGVSNDKISMLTKIEDKATIETIQQEAGRTSPTFSDHLQRMTTRFKSARKIGSLAVLIAAGLIFLSTPVSWGADPGFATPYFSVGVNNTDQPGAPTVTLQIFLLMTVLSLAPAIMIMVTSFTRIVIVLSLLRRALGTMQMPPNQIMVGLALFLTFFVMTPVWEQINQGALQRYLDKKISHQQAFQNAASPLRDFMFKQTREKDLALFVDIAKLKRPKNMADIPTTVLIPSFIISEVKTAFQIGLLLYVPFLIIDMVVASVLLSMGMMMLPPIMVSLPFKLMLFVLADGWYLLVGSLVKGFG